MRRLTGVGLGFVLVLLAGCGGASSSSPPRTATGAQRTPAPSGVGVIRAWAAALARGDVAGASAYFATPSTVQIATGEPAVTVRTAANARAVNLALPCGAQLLDTRVVGGYIDALFVLAQRPGADCGAGVGGTARVAFVIGGGKIRVWRRLPDEPGDAARAAPGYRGPGTGPAPAAPAAPGARVV